MIIPASKSILNRLLIIQSYFDFKIIGDSDADDVLKMKSALGQLLRSEMADCGSAGTTLRFLALRASRIPGTHHLAGSLRLFERPQTELKHVLEQLGCECNIGRQHLTVRGNGWQPKGDVVVDRSISSQFASSLFLNAWDLPFDLRVHFEGDKVSASYLSMTFDILVRAGMKFDKSSGPNDEKVFVVKAGARVDAKEMIAEPDASSAFSYAAVAAARGQRVTIENWPAKSLQPDAIFPDLLREMGCQVEVKDGVLRVGGNHDLKPISVNLKDAPDLFPVLAALAAVARGRSSLHGAPHLAHKESDRIARTADLVRGMGRKVKTFSDGIVIEGISDRVFGAPFKYSTDHDHRLAMAAAVAQAAGAPVEILDPKVVDKSFPGFWKAIQL